MKQFSGKIGRLLMVVIAVMMTFSACSSDGPDPDPDPEPVVPNENDYHFDIWVALDRHGGMGRDVQTLVSSVASLGSDAPMISFEGTGVEVNSLLTLETIVSGPYYIQIPVSGDRFSKYTINNNHINVVKERPFANNTYSPRKYCYTWLDDNTLLIMAANGDAKKILWTKLNTADMTIIAEGEMTPPIPDEAVKYSTSGIVKYRPQDNKIFYFYYGKSAGSAMKSEVVGDFYVAVINPSTMAIEKAEPNGVAAETVSSAYGELLQPSCFIDDYGNLYLASFNETDSGEHSCLQKIPAGQTSFDKSYNGFSTEGKLLAVVYLGGNNALCYARKDDLGTKIDSYSHYYATLDLATGTVTPVKYQGEMLPYSGGRFSSRIASLGTKAYFGINPEASNPVIYVYDAADGSVVKGAEMKEGYYFEQIRVVKNAE